MAVALTANIRKIYKKAGVKAPDGKGIHTEKFHKMVAGITVDAGSSDPNAVTTKKGKKVNPYAVAMDKLGQGKAVKKSHRRKAGEMKTLKLRKLSDDEVLVLAGTPFRSKKTGAMTSANDPNVVNIKNKRIKKNKT